MSDLTKQIKELESIRFYQNHFGNSIVNEAIAEIKLLIECREINTLSKLKKQYRDIIIKKAYIDQEDMFKTIDRAIVRRKK